MAIEVIVSIAELLAVLFYRTFLDKIASQNGSDTVIGTLKGQTAKNMENMEAVSVQFGEQIELKDIEVSVKISEPDADTMRIVGIIYYKCPVCGFYIKLLHSGAGFHRNG